MSTVTLTNVKKVYDGKVTAVHDFNLAINPGEFVVFVGPSGCGKSTTLRMIAGLEEISAGTIQIGGRTVNDVHPKDRDIAMVFQNYALYPHMTVYKNMAFGLILRKMPRQQVKERVTRAAHMLGLAELLDRKPKALSGGQRQRVALGRAIVREPKVFLFDEPLSNLDAKLRVTTRTEIKNLHQRLKTTTIYVTHDQEEAMTLGDRIVVMSAGLIQQVDTPMRIYRSPVNRFVAAFLGSPPMNFLSGTLSRGGPQDGGGIWFETSAEMGVPLVGSETSASSQPAERASVNSPGRKPGESEVESPEPRRGGSAAPTPMRIQMLNTHIAKLEPHLSQPVILGFRPSAMSEHATGKFAVPGGGNAITLIPEVVEPLGDVIDISCRIPGGGGPGDSQTIMARIEARENFPIGQPVDLYLDMDHVHIFEPGEFGRNLMHTV